MINDANVVPSKRGRRHKMTVLKPFNHGNAFIVVKHKDGRLGVVDVDMSTKQQIAVWFDAFAIEYSDKVDLANVCLPNIDQNAFEEHVATIGGIGKHKRWLIPRAARVLAGSVIIIVTNATSMEEFGKTTKNLEPFATWDMNFIDVDGVNVALVQVTDNDTENASSVLHKLKWHGYDAQFLDEEHEVRSKLGIERYDRSEHMWWNQDKQVAGPLRDTHRWRFSWIPTEWKSIPFTWQSLARNIGSDVGRECVENLPLPFRNHVCDELLRRKGKKNSVWKNIRGKECVTCGISEDQNIQLLTVGFFTLIAPFDRDITDVCAKLAERYAIHGYTSRIVGTYYQRALYLGHGATIRTFKRMTQYNRENLATSVLNKVCRSDGSMLGSGYKGTRGKYQNSEFPEYKPKKKMKRGADVDLRIREKRINIFAEYSKHETRYA